jgi:hypothetical protein
MVLPVHSDLTWDEVPDTLLALAACDLDDGGPPLPRLVAHRGDVALGLAELRPFGPGEVLHPVIELLALFLPLGADRVCLALPGRVWSLDDPIVPVLEEEGIDLRQRAVTLGSVDGHDGPARTEAGLHPFTLDDVGEWGWGPSLGPDERCEAPFLDAMRVLLDARHDLPVAPAERIRQLERVVGLGHALALAPIAARELGLTSMA